MLKLNWIYTALFALLLFSGGCDKLIYDNPVDEADKPTVYLSVSYGGASKLRSSNNEPGDPTINEDGTDYEDRVHDLMMFVFDSGSGSLITTFIDNSIPASQTKKEFTVKLTPGDRDFYFVANMPLGDLTGIKTRDALDKYLSTFRSLDTDLYSKATPTKGFPMERVYLKQEITEGGRIDNPTPFKPDGEEVVLLRRVVANLQINLLKSDEENEDVNFEVANIYYKNAFRKYSLTPETSLSFGDITYYENTEGNPLTKVDDYTYTYYMPEAIMPDEGVAWNNSDHKPINYFVIETTSGETYEVPIITHENTISGQEYLKFATGEQEGSQPNYNIYRNRRYVYTIKNLENIEIEYVVDPWKLVPTSLYMGYGYNVEIDPDGNIKITNTIDDCMPHKVRLEAKNGAHFEGGAKDTEKVYGYSSKTETGYDETKAKTGYSEQFGPINIDAVTAGDAYLEIFYNDVLVKTYKK